MASMSRVVVGIFAAWLLGVAPVGAAPPAPVGSSPVFVDAFDVEQVPALVPGAALQFSVFASPGASATVLVEGVRRLVELREVSPGVYEGVHVIDAADRIGAASAVVATVWRDGVVVRASLEESLVLDGPPPLRAGAPAHRGETPRPSPFPPAPVAPAPVSPRPAAPPPTFATPVPAAPPSEGRLVACRDCAVVESIRVVDQPSGPAAAGAVAGAIAGAVFGDTIGKAHEKRVTRVLGALGGAVIGHEIQRSSTRTWYDASLRMPNGALKVVRHDRPPPYRVGQLVPLDAAVAAGTVPSL
jgi:outer membrane lipoprotein SlyB